jgi:hypothetical protein
VHKNPIQSDFINSPILENSYIHLGILIHKILEIAIGSNDSSIVFKLIKAYSKYNGLIIDDKVTTNLQNLINKLRLSFKSDYKILTEVNLAAKYKKSNLLGTVDLLIIGEELPIGKNVTFSKSISPFGVGSSILFSVVSICSQLQQPWIRSSFSANGRRQLSRMLP